MPKKPAAAVAEKTEVARTRAAERMRRSRARRRDGIACYTVQVRDREVDVLIQLCLLPATERANRHSVIEALHRFFDETLGQVQ
jgi:hypothetical protein